MKKIIVSLCLLYAANGCAMGRVVAIATTSITVPGAYYACKTIMDQRKVAAMPDDSPEFKGMSPESREIEKHVLTLNANSFEPYMDGVAMGFVPGVNLARLIDRPMMGPKVSNMRADEKTGFFAGLTLWPNLILAMSLLKKIK